jgi:hypothetical protein
MIIKKLLLALSLLTSTITAETSLGLDINNEDVELLVELNFNTLTDYSSGTTYILDASYLYADSDNLATIGFSGQNTLQGVEGLTLSFGAKLAFAEDFIALPLMAKANYALPFIDTIPTTSLTASFAYAPSVLTFVDGETYSELRLEAGMEIISNTHIFAGYRNIDTDYKVRDYNLNDSFYGGIKLSF